MKTPNEWPGVTVRVDDIGREALRIRRPNLYFDAENESWPAEAELPLVMPEVLVDSENRQARSSGLMDAPGDPIPPARFVF